MTPLPLCFWRARTFVDVLECALVWYFGQSFSFSHVDFSGLLNRLRQRGKAIGLLKTVCAVWVRTMPRKLPCL